MVAIKALTLLALTGATLAVPVAQPLEVGEALVRRDADPQGPWQGQRANYSWRFGWGRPQGQGQDQTDGQSSDSSDSSDNSQSAPADQPSQPQAQPAQPTQPTEQPAASTPDASSGSSGGSSGGTGDYMSVVSTWRSNMGLPALSEDNTLQSNSLNAAESSGGQLKHKLNPGSMAQVMAPGNSGNFESVFVGGWLCEMPQLPGLGSSVCNSASQGWNHAGQTGHAEILSSTKYTKIGCGLAEGIWACDLA
jgi:hypothetical protein